MAVAHHWDAKDGGFFASADDSGPLAVRAKPVFDEPNAGGNAVMVEVLARLYYLTGNGKRRKRADQILQLFGGAADEPILPVAGFLNGAETHLAAVQVVIIGDRSEKGTQALLRHTVRTSLPTRVLQVIGPGVKLPDGHPAQYKTQIEGKATAYVCRGPVCSLPATDTADLGRTLVVMRQSANNRPQTTSVSKPPG